MSVAKSSRTNPKKFWNYVKSKTKTGEKISDIAYKTDSGEDRLTSRE